MAYSAFMGARTFEKLPGRQLLPAPRWSRPQHRRSDSDARRGSTVEPGQIQPTGRNEKTTTHHLFGKSMMQRRNFVKTTAIACAGCLAGAQLTGCKSIHYVNSSLDANRLTLPKSEFSFLKKDTVQYRSWVVVRNPSLAFPVGVYRSTNETF